MVGQFEFPQLDEACLTTKVPELYCKLAMVDPTSPAHQKAFAGLIQVVNDLEHKRSSKVFCLIHNGGGHICEPSMLWPVIKDRKQFRGGKKNLDLLIHSGGGDAGAAYRLITFLRGRYEQINALVPLQAKSAATLMCLGADSILMGEFAHLGPVDIQIADPLHRGADYFSPLDEFKAMEFLRDYAVELVDFFTGLFLERSGMGVKEALHEAVPCITGLLRPLYGQIDPIEMGEHRRLLAIGEQYATRLLDMVNNQNRGAIVEKLVWKYASHDFAINRAEAKALHLPVEPMDAKQEDQLLNVLTEFREYELSYCGFIPALRLPKSRQVSRKKPPKSMSTAKQRQAAAATAAA